MILSFALTTQEFLSDKKTATRRNWKPRTLRVWQKAWDSGRLEHQAVSRGLYRGGKIIGKFRLTARPELAPLSAMTAADLVAEGGMCQTVAQFCQFVGQTPEKQISPWGEMTVNKSTKGELYGAALPQKDANASRSSLNQTETCVQQTGRGATASGFFLTNELQRPPLRYHGGKWRIAPWIIAHMPEHSAYVEVFGGAAGVLLRKTRSHVEVYNDIDSQVFNFFRILRDREMRERLIEAVDLTPFCREEFKLAYEPAEDPVESARRFVTRTAMGFGTSSMDPNDSNGFRSCDIRAGKSYAHEWAGIPAAIAAAAERFKDVTIENLDFRKLIQKFDDASTLFYVDPPYPLATRDCGGKGYIHELTDSDHQQLAWLLKSAKAKVLLSGYSCRLYDDLYSSWRRDEKKTTANGQVGAVPRTEVLWQNF
jgi:DNA adenine methylase